MVLSKRYLRADLFPLITPEIFFNPCEEIDAMDQVLSQFIPTIKHTRLYSERVGER